MKMAYALGGAVAAAAALGFADYARHPASISRESSQERQGAGRPISGHPEPGRDPGVPEALLDRPGSALPPGHPSIGQAAMPTDGEQPLPPGHPSIGQGAMPTDGEQTLPPGHPGAAPTTPVPTVVPKLARAAGPNGYLVRDVYANEQRLAGQRVRVRGMVTKVTLDVLGATFLHLHDGSGDATAKTDDLAIKTLAQPARGDIVIFEGVLRLGVDVGAGYKYPILLEGATIVKE